jgi:hypothetical protein
LRRARAPDSQFEIMGVSIRVVRRDHALTTPC